MLAGARSFAPSGLYTGNYGLAQRRGLGSLSSPLGNSYGLGGGLGLGGALGLGNSLTGLGGGSRLGGISGITGLANTNTLGNYGALLQRPRLNPVLGQSMNMSPIHNALNLAKRGGFAQSNPSALLHPRFDSSPFMGAGDYLGNYVPPYRDYSFEIPVFVLPSRRSLHTLVNGGSVYTHILQLSISSTINDIYAELLRGGANTREVEVLTSDGNLYRLHGFADAEEIHRVDPYGLVVYESL